MEARTRDAGGVVADSKSRVVKAAELTHLAPHHKESVDWTA